jgi:hypothetical protein
MVYYHKSRKGFHHVEPEEDRRKSITGLTVLSISQAAMRRWLADARGCALDFDLLTELGFP